MYKILLLGLLLSFGYVHPIIKLPYGNVSSIRIDDIVWFALFLYWLIRHKPISAIKNAEISMSIIMYVIFCGFSLLSSFIFIDDAVITMPLVYGTFFYAKLIQYFSIYYMVSSVIWSDKDILLFMRVLFFMGIMVSFLGILQHVGVINLRYDPTIPQNSRHVTSTLSFNYAHLGVFQLVISLFTLSLFHEAKNILSKLFYSSALMLFLYVLFLSGSRAAFLGTVVALCIFFIYSDQKKYLLGMMSVGLLTIFVIGLPEYIVNRLGGGFGAGETGIGRMNSWKNFPDYFNASEFFNVLFGVGFMRFKFSAISYFHSTAGHNNFLNAYVETGIFGFFSFCYVIFSIFQKARRRLKDFVSGESRYFRIGYFASFIGLAVTCVSMETFSVVLAFTSFLGFFMFITGVFVGKRQ